MVELGAIMHAKIGTDVEYEPEAAEAYIRHTVEHGTALISDAGMIGWMDAPIFYGTKPALTAVTFWYSEDGNAWRLLDMCKAAARYPVAVSTHSPRMKRVLERKGYACKEEVMICPN